MTDEEIEEQSEHQACAHIGISTYKRNPDAYSLFKTGFRVGADWAEQENSKEVEQLKAQIEEMKCCENCKHWAESFDNYSICNKCEKLSDWECR